MIALRNRLAHGYFDMSLEIAHRTARDEIADVIAPIQDYLDGRM